MIVLFYDNEGYMAHSIQESLSNDEIEALILKINESFNILGVKFDVMNLPKTHFKNGPIPIVDKDMVAMIQAAHINDADLQESYFDRLG